jgi:hypothetical protein
MESNLNKIKKDIEVILNDGDFILRFMKLDAYSSETKKTYEEIYKDKKEEERKLWIDWANNFKIVSEYETWYSKSLKMIQLIQPDRINDFKLLYKNEKRKLILLVWVETCLYIKYETFICQCDGDVYIIYRPQQ